MNKRVVNCLLFFFLSLTHLVSFAQATLLPDKKTLAVVPFSSSLETGAQTYASSISEVVVNALVKSKRFVMVDRTHFEHLYTEENLQKGESFIEGIVVEQGKKLGAQFIVAGELISASASERYSEDDEDEDEAFLEGYVGYVSFSLKVINVETGEIIASENLSCNSGTILMIEVPHGSKEAAINKAIHAAGDKVTEFIDVYFPISASIFEVIRDSKRKIQEVVITGGRLKGFRSGQLLKLVEIRTVELYGQMVERKVPLGSLRVITVDDEHFSTCKVVKGKEELKLKMDEGANIQVLTGQSKSKLNEMIDAIALPPDVLKD